MDAETCDSLAQGALDQCSADCGIAPEVTCGGDCEVQAQDLFQRLADSRRPKKKAARKARALYKSCRKSCTN